MSYSFPRIALYDTTTQNIVTIGVPQVITFNTLDNTSKIIHTSSSRFTIIEPGRYSIVGKAQINLLSGSNKFIDIWIRKTGLDIPISVGRWGIPTVNNDISVPILGYTDCNINDYLEVWVTGDSTSLQIATVAPINGAPIVHSVDLVIIKTG